MLALGDDEDTPPTSSVDTTMDVVIVDIVSPDILRHVVGE